jgi:ABC-type bacteriocin/lantibiotic exporter with double-glycine peptidase domain
VVLIVSLFLLKNGQISVGQVFTLLLLFGNVIKPLDDFHRFLDEASEASLLTGDFKEIMEIPEDKVFDMANKSSDINSDASNIVEACNYSFGYNGQPILRNISFDIKQGEFYGIVGESGCGKSTLIKNILGFDYGNGFLKFKGADIKHSSR